MVRTLGFALSGGEPWEGCEQRRRNVSDVEFNSIPPAAVRID